jgi:hypothetical protein
MNWIKVLSLCAICLFCASRPAQAGPEDWVGEAGLRTLKQIEDLRAQHSDWSESQIDDALRVEAGGAAAAANVLPEVLPKILPKNLDDEDLPSPGGFDPKAAWNSLNPTEKKLTLLHPYQALQVNAAREEAIRETMARFLLENQHNGNGDAFRHALWNAFMVKRTSHAVAEAFANAHEVGSKAPALESKMDLFNNRVGRELARAVQGGSRWGERASYSAYVNAVDWAVTSGQLRRVDFGGVGGWDLTDGSGRRGEP